MSTHPHVWPCVNFDDARPMIDFAVDILGFEQVAVYSQPDDDSIVVHAELRWPEGGGFMCGSSNRPESPFSQMPTGAASIYIVTADPAAVMERCRSADATIVKPMEEESYGSTGFSVADPEGNIWSFGTYAGEGS